MSRRIRPANRVRILLLLLLIGLSLSSPASAAPTWEEYGIPAGGRFYFAGGLSPDLASVSVYFPAGTAVRPDAPLLPLLASRVFLGPEGLDAGGLLDADLAAIGWKRRVRCDLDGAGVFLAGPKRSLEPVLGRVLRRLESAEPITQDDLDRAWSSLEADWERWSRAPEVNLRADMARRHYGEHPYAVDLGRRRPESAARPDLEALRAFVGERYQAGAMQLLVAGDLEPAALLDRWQDRLDALPGRILLVPESTGEVGGGGEFRHAADGRNLMLLQFPVPAGDVDAAASTAVLAGVLRMYMKEELPRAGLAWTASAWYDYTAMGPQPLEVRVRDFPGERGEEVKTMLLRIFERIAAEDFSEYKVITAKDILFQQMDVAAGRGEGPRDSDVNTLLSWGQQVLRHGLHFRRWRVPFERSLLATSKEDVADAARRYLDLERATLGLLIEE